NAQGGTNSEVANAAQFDFGLTLDVDRLLGIRDAVFQISISDRVGRNLSVDARLGSLQEVQEVFGRGRAVRLTEFWFDQTYLYGAIDWKVGRGPFEDFAAFECDFQNLTFCGPDPGNTITDYVWNWPISQWMTSLKFNSGGFGYFQVSIYDDNPKYLG